ncbi:MAG: APC family permease [Chloroflexi bacterium]|nr:APC family permease [Chloroflexota bacterium]
MANVLNWLVGTPIATSRAMHERLTKVKALAVFSSDALSSVAYATDEILYALLLAGPVVLSSSVPIALAIGALLIVVAASYRQTIHAYPNGGGSYIVAKDNLGPVPGLTAGAALLIDYVLTVAVSISSGVLAITSAFPSLEVFRVEIALGFLLFITLANMRGLRESSSIFMLPTYAFIISIFSMIAVSLYRYYGLGLTQPAPTDNIFPSEVTMQIGIFLLLRAFAAGCTALTGVEAISNGVPAFRPPESNNAARTLVVMVMMLTIMFLGITWLANIYHTIPQADHESTLSQLARTAFGDGPLYLFVQVSTMLILVLAANTSFADFPRLSAIIARDGYLPHLFIRVGQRLVFSTGIMVLALFSATLIIVFDASTHNLIPLYAVGVFLSFTLSQAGMVRHWWRLRGPGWRRSMIVNGTGATATAVVTLVIVEAKLIEGAWVVVLLIPAMVFVFLGIKRHYDAFQSQIMLKDTQPIETTNIVIVPVARVDQATARTMSFARTIGGSLTGAFVFTEAAEGERMMKEWQAAHIDAPLKLIASPFRSVVGPLLKYIESVGQDNPNATIVVVLPEIVPKHFAHLVLHNQTAQLIKLSLLFQRKRIVVSVPFHLES